MDKEFYNLENLKKYSNNICIIERSNALVAVSTYGDVIQKVEKLLEIFKKSSIPNSIGIALRFAENAPTRALCVLLLGILNHKCYFCPLDYKLKRDSLRLNLKESRARFIISDTAETHEILNTKLLRTEQIFNSLLYISEIVDRDASENILPYACYAISTSGSTTGLPKMVFVTYKCIAPNVSSLSQRLSVTSCDVIALISPITFDPFVIEFFLGIFNGAALLVTTPTIRLSPKQLITALFPQDIERKSTGVTVMQMTPSLFRLFGNEDIRQTILNDDSSLRILLLGGEHFPTKLELKSWLPRGKHIPRKKIYNIYGITEVSCWSTIHECTMTISESINDEDDHFPIGEPIDDETELLIVSAGGEVSHHAGQGELQIGSSTRKCYIPQVDGENLSSIDRTGPLYRRTGDLVERTKSGDIFYKGRLNNTVKRMGKRLCLDALSQKIEAIVCSSESKAHPLVICLWECDSQKLICCLINSRDTRSHLFDPHAIMETLDVHEKPDIFHRMFYQSVPLNAHGKINRSELLRFVLLQRQKLQTPTEIFTNFLRETIGVGNDNADDGPPSGKKPKHETTCTPWTDQSFTEAGGTSYHALHLATEIGECLADALDQRSLLEMLLNERMSITEVLKFLSKAKTRANNQTQSEIMPALTREFNLQWRVDMLKCIDAAPTPLSESLVCVGSHGRLLLTLDTRNGRELSRVTLPDRIECKVEPIKSFGEFVALVGCYNGLVYAFDYVKGQILWKIHAGDMVKAKPLLVNNIIIVASYNPGANLLAYCPQSHQTLWRDRIGSKGIYSSPVRVGDSSFIVCSLDGTYSCLQAGPRCITKWQQKCSSPIFSTPALIHNETELIVAEVSGKVNICDMTNGEMLHTFRVDGNIYSSITTYSLAGSQPAELVIFGCHDKYVYCLKYERPRAPFLLWRVHLQAAVYAAPIVVQYSDTRPYVIAISTKGLIALIELGTGLVRATHELHSDVFSTPCLMVKENLICIGCRDNFLYCFDLQ